MKTAFISVGFLVALLVTVAAAFGGDESTTSLRAEIAALTARNGVIVVGLDQIDGAEPTKPLTQADNFEDQLANLLHAYNHILVRRPDGELEKVIIAGRRLSEPASGKRTLVATQREASGHFVTAEIAGAGNTRLSTRLLIDTGAEICVLPASAKGALGYADVVLPKATFWTAGGEIKGERATLTSLEVGRASASQVSVAFIADDLLPVSGLLGMSFFKHFVTSIDLERNLLILEHRP